MSVYDEAGNLVESPDLELGRIETRTRTVHHDAIPEQPRITENVRVSIDPKNPKKNQLYEEKVIQSYVQGRPAWDEQATEQIYVPYTPEELAERERQREEAEAAAAAAEAAAAEAAEKQARIDALPGQIDDLEEAVAELGVMSDANNVSNEEVMEAIAELGAMVANIQDVMEVSNG